VQTIPDLAIPEVKPAIELYRGERRQKVSPRYTHARMQMRLAFLLDNWASDRGRIGTEWRFYFIEHGRARSSSLVPDIAYVSFERLAADAGDEAECPTIAPDIAIEILSPNDRAGHVRQKVELYRFYGTRCVVLVDPQTRSATIYDSRANTGRTVDAPGSVHIVDDLTIDLGALFDH